MADTMNTTINMAYATRIINYVTVHLGNELST